MGSSFGNGFMHDHMRVVRVLMCFWLMICDGVIVFGHEYHVDIFIVCDGDE